MSKGEGFVGDTLSMLFGWFLGIAVVMLLLCTSISDEEDELFNCHLSGNMVCGEGAVWHGYVNL